MGFSTMIHGMQGQRWRNTCLAGMACVYGLLHVAAGHADTAAAHATREQIIGAWRLIRVATVTHRGEVADAFFHPGSIGLIVYDASGWMSVQISGAARVPWEVPETRSSHQLDSHLRLKAAAYDSYYAYFGTWNYDRADAVMTHHVTSSVIPAEAGLDYAQLISMEGNRMTFTGHGRQHGEDYTRIKVWERVGRP